MVKTLKMSAFMVVRKELNEELGGKKKRCLNTPQLYLA